MEVEVPLIYAIALCEETTCHRTLQSAHSAAMGGDSALKRFA